MELTNLNCPVCGSPIPNEAVHVELGVARCPACKGIYDLSPTAAAAEPKKASPKASRPRFDLPAKFKLEDRGERGLTVSWRWLAPVHFASAIFCAALVAVSVSLFLLPNAPRAQPYASTVPVGPLVMAALAGYMALAGFLNRTTVDVNRERIKIQHAPVPWTGNMEIPSRELTQLYCTEEAHSSRRGDTVVTYDLHAIDRAGTKRKLLTGLSRLEQALWLEQTIEERLGIVDHPVDGEIATRWA